MSPKHKNRLILTLIGLCGISSAIALVLYALSQNINLFYTPTDIATGQVQKPGQFRLGGMVVKGSVQREKNLQVNFKLTDFQNEILVYYNGILPDLFREGQGIVALGKLDTNNQFVAKEVLAKHDENYMPPEVAAALKTQNAKN